MSKSKKKRYEDEEFDDGYHEIKKAHINKRRARRFDRALKIKNIDDIMEYEDFDCDGNEWGD